jgi:hypothetical protein
VNNFARGGNEVRNAQGPAPITYADFLATRPPTFAEAGEPFEADHWLHTIESKFGLLRCKEHQKTLFAVQQLLGNAGACWANFTAVLPTNHQVQWDEFREAFRAQHIPAGFILTKHQEFMDLRQGRKSIHDYSKLFNHLAQYALEQVETDEKKKASFIRGLSTKLKEHLLLYTGGTFLEFVSKAIIADNAIHGHKKGKKRKAMTAPSGSAPPKYQVVHPSRPANPLRRHQHQHWSGSSGLPTHIRAHTSRQHRGLYHYQTLRYTCQCHRLLEPPPAPSASTVVVLAIFPETTPLRRRTQLRATSTIHPVANRRLLLPGLAV